MSSGSGRHERLRFGAFELDAPSGELRCAGRLVKIGPQPLRVLEMLARRHGEVVTREEIQRSLWADGTFVDFEGSLNFCIKRLRHALGDDPKNPRYIETLPRRGYRFIPDVSEVEPSGRDLATAGVSPPPTGEEHLERVPTPGDDPFTGRATVTSAGAGIGGRRRVRAFISWAAAALALATAGWAVRRFLTRPVSPRSAFQNPRIEPIDSGGAVLGVGLSPDGKFILLSKTEAGGQGLWLRNIATGTEIRLAGPANYVSLAFSPDANFAYYVARSRSGDFALYRVPVLGGAVQPVATHTGPSVTFSPNGARIAYVRAGVAGLGVMAADPDGKEEVPLCSVPRADRVNSIAWSRDGKRIALSLFGLGNTLSGIAMCDVVSGKTTMFVTYADMAVGKLAWMPDGNLLIVQDTGRATEIAQIGLLSYPGSKLSPLTRGGNYRTLSVSADGKVMAAVSWATMERLNILGPDGRVPNASSPTSQLDGVHTFQWDGSQGLLLTERSRLLRVPLDGHAGTVLVNEPTSALAYAYPCSGRFIVFNWYNHQGQTSVAIWRVNANGGSAAPLTHGSIDYAPVCSADGRWVYFLEDYRERTFLERVPSDGGKPPVVVQVSPAKLASLEAFSLSPGGKELACLVAERKTPEDHARLKLSLVPLDSRHPPHLLDPDPRISGGPVFTPDGKALAYPIREGLVDNVWVQPLDGSAGRRLTDFTIGEILEFAWSPDGRKLGVLRRFVSTQAVLFRAEP